MLPGAVLGRNIDEVFDNMSALTEADTRAGSRRAIFLQLYLMVTSSVREKIRQGGYFQDNAWAARYLTAFANLYGAARFAYDNGRPVPKSWRIAFRTADDRAGLVLQDLLLGVNAHINHDLALALLEAGINDLALRESRYRDHTAVNAILEGLTNASQDKIAQLYAPGLAMADQLAGPIDEITAAFSIEQARENAWRHAVTLAGAGPFEEAMVRAGLDVQAGVLGRLILAPVRIAPGLKAAFQAVEQGFQLG